MYLDRDVTIIRKERSKITLPVYAPSQSATDDIYLVHDKEILNGGWLPLPTRDYEV